jgi:hypothetical protein
MLKQLLGRKKRIMEIQKIPDPVSDFPHLDQFWQTTEVSAARFFINELFKRKFNSEAPAFGHHWVSFYKSENGECWPATYVHASIYGPLILIGGVMTDGAVLQRMKPEHRDAIIEAGGCYFTALRHVFKAMSDQCEAFAGLISDPRSMEVSCAAGFEPSGHDKLVVYCPRPVSAERREEFIKIALSAGPF